MNVIRSLSWLALAATSLVFTTAMAAGNDGRNTQPVADASSPQTVMQGETVVLDGSGSYDSDGDRLTFQWTLVTPGGSNAVLSDPTAVRPTFVADVAGEYIATLVVNDGQLDSDPCVVKVVTEPGNSAPTADAGDDQTVILGSTVQLSGSGTDPDGNPLSFNWTVTAPDGSDVTLSDPTIPDPTFVADQVGDYVATLVVNDGHTDSAPDSITVTTLDNSPPIADAGDPQNVAPGDNVDLDGSGSSDPDGNPLTYSWTFTAIPDGSTATLANANTVSPNFVADLVGIYVVQLIVNDGMENSVPDTVMITASDPATVSIGDAVMPLTESTIQFEVTLDGAVPGGVTVQYRVVIPPASVLLTEFFSMANGAVTFTGNGPTEVQLTGAGALFNAAVRPPIDLAFCVFIGDPNAPVAIGDELGVGTVLGNTPAVIPDDICDGVVNPLTGTAANAASSLISGDDASTASGIGAIGLLCLVTVAIRRRRFTV